MRKGYRQFHGLTGPAFGKTIGAAQLLVYQQVEELDEELDSLLSDGGIGILTGEIGMGKTTSVRHFLESPGERSFCWTYQGSSRHSTAVLEGLTETLGMAPARHRFHILKQISAWVSRTFHEQRKRTLLVVDDAHMLEDSLLEDLRLLTNYEMDFQEPMALLLVGHPSLRKRLQRPIHEALWNRVRMLYRLEGLSAEETSNYIDCHLLAAGGGPEIFSAAARLALFELAQGVPRRINSLALDALKDSARQNIHTLDSDFISQVATRKQARERS